MIRLESAPIPRITVDQVGRFLGEVVGRRMVAFIVSGGDDALSAVHSEIVARGGRVDDGRLQFGDERGDVGWHLDGELKEDASEMDVNIHHTTAGEGRVDILATTRQLWELGGARGPSLDRSLRDTLDGDGQDFVQIDEDYEDCFDPLVVYTGHLREGDVVVFAYGGLASMAHRFTTVASEGRTSFAQEAHVPTVPVADS